jgi:hypothetical protein
MTIAALFACLWGVVPRRVSAQADLVPLRDVGPVLATASLRFQSPLTGNDYGRLRVVTTGNGRVFVCDPSARRVWLLRVPEILATSIPEILAT